MNDTWSEESVTVSESGANPVPAVASTTQWAIECILMSLCAVTVVVNPVTLTAMVKSKLVMVSSINVFITSLCFSDLLVGLSVFAFRFPLMSTRSTADDIHLRRAKFVAGVSCMVSFMISSINGFHITLDRALATMAPHKYKTKMTAKKASIAVVATWTGATVFLSSASAVNAVLNDGFGDIDYPDQVLPKSLLTYFTTQFLIVGMVANVVLYALIVRSLFKSGQKVHASRNSLSEKRNIQMTRMVVIVIGVMLLGNLPIVVIAAIPAPSMRTHSHPVYEGSHRMAYDLAMCSASIPTFVNNVIYVGRVPDFKKAIRNLLFCEQT